LLELGRLAGLLRPLVDDGLLQLGAQWRHHLLTLLGIVWGAAAVVLLLSYGAGFYSMLDLGFKKTGDRYVGVSGGYTSTELGGTRPGRPIRLTREDLERLRAGVASARWVAAESQWGTVTARTSRRTRTAILSAATPELQWIKAHRVERGRFYDEEDERLGRPVAVLGASLPEIYFGSQDPIGQTIQVDGRPFEVIGVLRRKGNQFVTQNGPNDDMIFIPLSQGQRLYRMGNEVEDLLLHPHRLDETDQMIGELRAALWPHHRIAPQDEQAVQYMAVQEFIVPVKRIAIGLEFLLGFIGTVILAMAGVGVANLMAAMVSQRRVELAMRRACGARRSDLTLQLLVETLVVVLLGGLLGVLIGVTLVWGVALLPLPEEVPAPRVELSVLATTFAVLVGVGLVSGITPARNASRIDPAAALRVN
jgi:putative ABC transport system permease protein